MEEGRLRCWATWLTPGLPPSHHTAALPASSGMRSSWPPLGINCDPVSKQGLSNSSPAVIPKDVSTRAPWGRGFRPCSWPAPLPHPAGSEPSLWGCFTSICPGTAVQAPSESSDPLQDAAARLLRTDGCHEHSPAPAIFKATPRQLNRTGTGIKGYRD